jgi:hypothetical protein
VSPSKSVGFAHHLMQLGVCDIQKTHHGLVLFGTMEFDDLSIQLTNHPN